MKHVFIVNPAAGNGMAEKVILPKIHKATQALDVDCEIHRTLSEQDILSYVRQRASTGEPVRFYACGGDGTLNNTLRGMVGCKNASIATIPCGTGNDFVRNFSNKDYFMDVKRQINGSSMAVDVIQYGDDKYAINMLNIGVDCDVVVEAARYKTSTFLKGTAAYMAGAAKVLSRGKTYKMAYSVDGGELVEEELMLAAIANGHFCGGGFKSSPKASLTDGCIDVCIVKPIKGARILRLLAQYRAGTHLDAEANKAYVTHIKCKTFALYAREPVYVSTDGEVSDFAEMQCRALPGEINFILPEGVQPL